MAKTIINRSVKILCYNFSLTQIAGRLKGALDKFNIIPNFFQKKSWDFNTIRNVGGMGNDCMPSFTF